MPRRSKPQDQDPNFFEELKASSIDLPVAVQNEFAAMVSRAYSSQTLGVPHSQIPSLPISHPLIDQYLPGVNTMGGVEDALNRSLITPLMGMTQRVMENKGGVDPSSIFSDLYFGALDAARTYQPTYRGRPTTFSHFAQRSAFQAASSGNRREMQGLSIDQFVNDDGDLLPSAPSALTTDFVPGGQTAPYTTPPKRWYDSLTKTQSPIPSPFYAPEGEGFLTGGQLNPNLRYKPGAGLSQVVIQPNEMRQFVREYATDSSLYREQPKQVRQFMKQTAEGLRGGGFISTDDDVLGAVAGADQALVETLIGNGSDRFDYTGVAIDRDTLFRSSRAKNLPKLISKTAASDPATAAAMYLQGAAEGRIGPRDIRNIAVPSGDKNLGEYVSNNFDDLTDALNVIQEGYGYTAPGPEELRSVVDQLRASNPAAVKSGEMIAEGNMRGIRTEDVGTYNRGRDAVRSATAAAESIQRERMGLNEPARPVDDVPAVPEPEAPPEFGAYSRTKPVSDVGNVAQTLDQPVSARTAARASTPVQEVAASLSQPATPETVASAASPVVGQVEQSRNRALSARRAIEQEFPDFMQHHFGRGPENRQAFDTWRNNLGGRRQLFEELWSDLHGERKFAPEGQSVYSEMVKAHGWKGAPRSSSIAKNDASVGGPASSPVSATPPAAQPPVASSNGSRGGSGNIPPTTTSAPAADPGDEFWNQENGDVFEEGRAPFDQHTARQREMQAERDTRTRSGIRNTPRSARQMSNMVEAAYVGMSEVSTQQVYAGGSYHGVYGLYDEQTGEFKGSQSGLTTISKKTQGQAEGIYQQALNKAFDQGGFEGLSNKEFAATVHKRVQQGIQKIVDGTVDEMIKASPENAAQAKSIGQQLRTVAGDLLSHADGKLREAGDTSRIGDTNMSSVRAHGKSLKELMDSSPELAKRVDELGGFDNVSKGPRRVLIAGDQSYEVGAADGGFGGGGGRGGFDDHIKSIYSSNVGHLMMAQFMASMAWKSTGGAVLDSANQWSQQQYGYIPMAAYGGGQLSNAQMATARQEVFANRMGSMAYQQYGVFGDLGYMMSAMPGGENILRFGNDAKMMAGTAAVAGIGTWGLGALMGSTALTAAAAPVGLAAGLAVGVPSLGFSVANAVTGTEDYGWKQSIGGSIAGLAAMDRFGVFGMAGESGNLWTVKGQEEFAGKRGFGSLKEMVADTWIGDAVGAENINYFFGGNDDKSIVLRKQVEELQLSTGLKEDVLQKQMGAAQVALGGLDTDEKRKQAGFIISRAAEQGVDATAILSSVSSIASQRGVLEGTEEYGKLAMDYSALSPVEQQKEILKQSRNFQKYAQWVPYLEGGNAEGYALFNQLGGGVNMAQTQAIQQVFAQAQMSGVNLSPATAQSLATTANNLAPWKAMDVTRMSASLTELGASNFTGAFTNLAGALQAQDFGFNVSDAGNANITRANGNQTDTLNFIKGVTSGNAYALSDYGRMANIGVLQSLDAGGLQTGMKDMSGLLLFAQQNVLRQPGLTGAQTLAGLGMTFGSTDQNDLLSGGMWGYQQSYVNQTNNLQQQGLNLQFQQLASNRGFMYQSWGIEDQMMATQWNTQQANFDFSGLMMDTQMRHRREDFALGREQRDLSNESNTWLRDFDYQTSLMRRDFAREDYQFQTQMRQLSFGWNMEDVNEQIRRSSGYDRAMLIKQRDRMTLSENLQTGQAEKKFDQQEQLWAREDERYKKGVEFNEQMIELDTSRMELNMRQAEEMFILQKGHLEEEIASATRLHELRMEMEGLQRARQEEQLRHSEQSLNIQQQMMNLQNEYQHNVTIISHTQTEMEAALRKITSYSPAFSRMLSDFLTFLERSSTLPTPGYGGTVTYR